MVRADRSGSPSPRCRSRADDAGTPSSIHWIVSKSAWIRDPSRRGSSSSRTSRIDQRPCGSVDGLSRWNRDRGTGGPSRRASGVGGPPPRVGSAAGGTRLGLGVRRICIEPPRSASFEGHAADFELGILRERFGHDGRERARVRLGWHHQVKSGHGTRHRDVEKAERIANGAFVVLVEKRLQRRYDLREIRRDVADDVVDRRGRILSCHERRRRLPDEALIELGGRTRCRTVAPWIDGPSSRERGSRMDPRSRTVSACSQKSFGRSVATAS